MAIEEHLNILREGVQEINKWQLRHQGKGLDLSGAKLDEYELHDVNLSHANFSNASLYRVKLASANLTGANFSGAMLQEVLLSKADLSRA